MRSRMFGFGGSTLEPPSLSTASFLFDLVPTIPLHTRCCIFLISAYQLQTQSFTPLSSRRSSFSKYICALPVEKTLHPPHTFTPCPSASFSSCLAPVFSTPGQLCWRVSVNCSLPQQNEKSRTSSLLSNPCSSITICLPIQLFFLAFASSFLTAPRSIYLPVHFELLFSLRSKSSLWFLNFLIQFTRCFLMTKGALQPQGMRPFVSTSTLYLLCARGNWV